MTSGPVSRHETTSPDGTVIARWASGSGPPLLLVHGAMSDHRRWRLQPFLEPHRRVHTMDRRGRGESGDAPHWSLNREVEDVVAVIEDIATESGSGVDVLGHSLGGLLVLRAALATAHVRRLVVYEPSVNEHAAPVGIILLIEQQLAQGRRAEAVRTLMRDVVHMPQSEITQLEALPSWPARLAAAHTLPRELGIDLVIDPADLSQITVPVLDILGEDSPEQAHNAARTLAASLPNHQLLKLKGQQHVADQIIPEEFARHVLGFLEDANP